MLRDGLYTADQINLNQLGINERQNRLGVEDYTAGIFLCMSIASAHDMRRHEYSSFMKLSCSLSKNTNGINRPHHAAIVFSFSACVSYATIFGKSYGPQINRKSSFENIWSGSFRDRGPRYPRYVPWDQFFGLKNFLLS